MESDKNNLLTDFLTREKIFNLIIRNDASNLFFFPYLLGRPATARQADDVPIAIGRSTGNVSVYQILSCFSPFTGSIGVIQID